MKTTNNIVFKADITNAQRGIKSLQGSMKKASSSLKQFKATLLGTFAANVLTAGIRKAADAIKGFATRVWDSMGTIKEAQMQLKSLDWGSKGINEAKNAIKELMRRIRDSRDENDATTGQGW